MSKLIEKYLDDAKPRGYPTVIQSKARRNFLQFEIKHSELKKNIANISLNEIERVKTELLARKYRIGQDRKESPEFNTEKEIVVFEIDQLLKSIDQQIDFKIETHNLNKNYKTQERLNSDFLINKKVLRHENMVKVAKEKHDLEVKRISNGRFTIQENEKNMEILALTPDCYARKIYGESFDNLHDELKSIGALKSNDNENID